MEQKKTPGSCRFRGQFLIYLKGSMCVSSACTYREQDTALGVKPSTSFCSHVMAPPMLWSLLSVSVFAPVCFLTDDWLNAPRVRIYQVPCLTDIWGFQHRGGLFLFCFSGLSSRGEEVFEEMVLFVTKCSDLPSVFRATTTMMMLMMYGSYKHDPN